MRRQSTTYLNQLALIILIESPLPSWPRMSTENGKVNRQCLQWPYWAFSSWGAISQPPQRRL